MVKLTANVPLLGGVYDIVIRGRKIASVTKSRRRTDLYAGPALFDVQVNGYGGESCKLRSAEKKEAVGFITRMLRENGVGWWIPTVVTDFYEPLATALRLLGEALDEDPDTAESIPGFHMEGPYLSPEDGPRGAHNRAAVRPPDWKEFSRLQKLSGDRIRYITLAPEWPGAEAFIRKCVASGVVVSLGHSMMNRADLERAVEAGATLSTHVGNGAHHMLPRKENYIWYQLANRKTFAAFISDGEHLPADCLYSVLRAKGLDLSLITSDSVNLAGLPPGTYGPVEKLPSGRLNLVGTPNLSGSSSNLRECVENVIRSGGVSHAEAWRLGSIQPARAMRLDGRLGIAPGKDATLTVYRYGEKGPKIDVLETWVAGRKVFDAATGERETVRTGSVDLHL